MAEVNQPLDEVLLAMDVVDTLRHRAQLVDQELGAEGRRADLLKRLRDIYSAQGIEVPDHILQDGVAALEERRFAYEPPAASFSVRLARLYVSRERWGKPVIAGLAALGIGFGGYQTLVAGPQKAEKAAIVLALEETLPEALASLAAEVADLAKTEEGDQLANAYLQAGQAALRERDADAARDNIAGLETLRDDLEVVYDVRVRYRDNAESGFSRTHATLAGRKNYYLVVEAIDPRGTALTVPISSEEFDESKRVKIWAQRVSRTAFETVVADKQDDTIIQNDTIGRKLRGYLEPDYDIETQGGAILEW